MPDQTTAQVVAAIAGDLTAEQSEVLTVQRVAEQAIATIDGCQEASITVRRRGRRLETLTSTATAAEDCDDAQYTLGEGPCVESIFEESLHVSGDLANEPRWSRWGPRAAELGMHSVLSLRLATDGNVLGALNMYSSDLDAFDDEQVELAALYTNLASNAMARARLIDGLRIAVDTRHTIGVAQGILMSSYSISLQSSFDLLTRYSSQTNTKLRDLAAHVVEHGALPSAPREDPTAAPA